MFMRLIIEESIVNYFLYCLLVNVSSSSNLANSSHVFQHKRSVTFTKTDRTESTLHHNIQLRYAYIVYFAKKKNHLYLIAKWFTVRVRVFLFLLGKISYHVSHWFCLYLINVCNMLHMSLQYSIKLKWIKPMRWVWIENRFVFISDWTS